MIDRKWREHLYEMDYLRDGVSLRAYAQRDPLVEYQREGFDMFNQMLEGVKEETVGFLFHVRVQARRAAGARGARRRPAPRRSSPVERTSPTRAVAPAAAPGGSPGSRSSSG